MRSLLAHENSQGFEMEPVSRPLEKNLAGRRAQRELHQWAKQKQQQQQQQPGQQRQSKAGNVTETSGSLTLAKAPAETQGLAVQQLLE